MNILFLSQYYPGNLSEQCFKISKIGLNWASHNLNTAIIRGFNANDIKPRIINIPPMGSFPAFAKSTVVPGYSNGNVTSLPYHNIAYFKRLEIRRKTLAAIRKWDGQNKGEKVILLYNFNFSHIIPQLKKEFPTIKIILLVTDLPEYIDTNRTLLTRINDIISPQTWNKLCLDGVDGYILLAQAMTERLPMKGKPWLLMEGIYNDETSPEHVEKDKNKVIMYTGNLGERYGIRTLLEAFTHITSPEYRLWIRGNGGLEHLVCQYAEKDSRIKIIGKKNRTELMRLQQAATVMVNPVLEDEEFTPYFFPSKTLEYMASGTPTLMSRLRCLPKEYDEHLFYFNDNSARGIAQRIMEICNMPEDVLADFGRQASSFIIENKSPQKQIQRVIQFIEEL